MTTLRRIALALAGLGLVAGTAVGVSGTTTADGVVTGHQYRTSHLADTGWD